jgi:archaetidylinositol phosphate synthase
MKNERHNDVEQTNDFRPAEREHLSLLSAIEKKTLLWIAQRLPAWVNPDHLTALGFVSLIAVGLSYGYSRWSKAGLWLAIGFFILNWFGDSLDGTLARVRQRQRPRYGFYVDHVLDACGSVFVFAGLAMSGYMSERVAVGLLVAYFLLSIEVYLATYTVGKFQLSFAMFSPTELRLLLIAGNIALLRGASVMIAGKHYLLFDVGGVIGIAGITIAFLWSMAKHTAHLYREERLL